MPAPRSAPAAFTPQTSDRLRMSVSHRHGKAAVLEIVGDVDLGNVARLRELLWERLRTALRLVVLDLTGVRFLSVTGVELLAEAQTRAETTGRALRVVGRHPAIVRPVAAAGLLSRLSPHATVGDALPTTGWQHTSAWAAWADRYSVAGNVADDPARLLR